EGRMIEALRTYSECFVCGEDNPAGLQAAFTLGEAPDELRGAFTADGRYQGYPGRLHGGVLASLFDETLGRAVALHGHWSFTARLDVRLRQPVPVGARNVVYGRLPRFGLSARGHEQARRVAACLADVPLAAIYTSPLLRARQTTAAIAADHAVPVRRSALLLEIGTSWAGTPNKEVPKG